MHNDAVAELVEATIIVGVRFDKLNDRRQARREITYAQCVILNSQLSILNSELSQRLRVKFHVGGLDGFSAQNYQAFNHVAEFTNVSRPRIGL